MVDSPAGNGKLSSDIQLQELDVAEGAPEDKAAVPELQYRDRTSAILSLENTAFFFKLRFTPDSENACKLFREKYRAPIAKCSCCHFQVHIYSCKCKYPKYQSNTKSRYLKTNLQQSFPIFYILTIRDVPPSILNSCPQSMTKTIISSQ